MAKLNADWNEFEQELRILIGSDSDWCISLLGVPAPEGNGKAFALAITPEEVPGSPIIAVTDKSLLAKLRTAKGQFVYHWDSRYAGLPVYYYEYCRIDPRQRIMPDPKGVR